MITELFRNFGLSFLLNVAPRAANALMFVLIGRRLGPEPAGVFQLALTYLLFFSVLTRGLDDHVMRQVAQVPADARRYLGSFVVVRLLANVALYGVLALLILYGTHYPDATALIILMTGACVVTDSLGSMANAVMVGLRYFALPTGIAVGLSLIRLVVSGLVMFSARGSIAAVAVLWLASSVVSAAVSLIFSQQLVRALPRRDTWDFEFVKGQLPAVWPFVVNGFLMAVEFQVDVILLSFLHGEREVGIYSAATTVVATLLIISQAYRFAVYPTMAAIAAESEERLRRLYDKSLSYLSALAVPIVIGIIVLAPGIVKLVFASGFSESIVVLRILIVLVLLNFLNVPSNRVMFVCHRQKWITWMLTGSMSVNLVLNLLLTPRYGATGAALARIGSSLLYFIVNFYVLGRFVLHWRPQLHKLMWRPFLAGALMAVVIGRLQSMPVVIASGIGGAVYIIVFIAIGGISTADRRVLTGWLQRQVAGW